MRRLTFIIICSLIAFKAISQDCTDPLCKQIASLLEQIVDLNESIKKTQANAEDYFAKWKHNERKSKASLERAIEYEKLYNQQREIAYQNFVDLTRQNNELVNAYNRAKQ